MGTYWPARKLNDAERTELYRMTLVGASLAAPIAAVCYYCGLARITLVDMECEDCSHERTTGRNTHG